MANSGTERAVSVLAAALAAIMGLATTVQATIDELNDPWFGVDKTGATDVTEQVNAILATGVATMPAGTFQIDPTKTVQFLHDITGAVDITGRPTTFLVAKPSATPRDCVAEVAGEGIVVRNIFVVGDRMAQLYTAGTTNEWGYGFKVTGKGATLVNCYAICCTGDGFGIVAPGVTLQDCVADQNRRNGLSGFNCPGLHISGGAYTNTGKVTVDGVTDLGAPKGPWAGVDIEPDRLASGTPNVDVLLQGVSLIGNQGSGVQGYLRSEVGGVLTITVNGCPIRDNMDGVRGEALAGAVAMFVTTCVFSGHKGAAVRANSGSTIGVKDCTIGGLKPRTTSFTKAGIVTPYDLKQYGTGIINAGSNTYI